MARAQTVFSELEVAKSILNVDNLSDVRSVVQSDIEIYSSEQFLREKNKKKKKQNVALQAAGSMMRSYLQSIGCSNFSVRWIGKDQQSGIERVASDLEIEPVGFRLSVKENANVYINGSPKKIFIDAPKGIFGQKERSENWFIKVAAKELQDYFLACSGIEVTGYNSVIEYYKNCKGVKNKKIFSSHVQQLHKEKSSVVLETYSQMCKAVASESAQIFNENYKLFFNSLTNQNAHNTLIPMFHFFFKINGVKYFLLGCDKDKPMALIVPSSREWLEEYNFLGVKAIAVNAGQPEVDINFSFQNKNTKEEFIIPIKVEIRWSHGKFCGNPEAKVYKKWAYKDLPWVKKI